MGSKSKELMIVPKIVNGQQVFTVVDQDGNDCSSKITKVGFVKMTDTHCEGYVHFIFKDDKNQLPRGEYVITPEQWPRSLK